MCVVCVVGDPLRVNLGDLQSAIVEEQMRYSKRRQTSAAGGTAQIQIWHQQSGAMIDVNRLQVVDVHLSGHEPFDMGLPCGLGDGQFSNDSSVSIKRFEIMPLDRALALQSTMEDLESDQGNNTPEKRTLYVLVHDAYLPQHGKVACNAHLEEVGEIDVTTYAGGEEELNQVFRVPCHDPAAAAAKYNEYNVISRGKFAVVNFSRCAAIYIQGRQLAHHAGLHAGDVHAREFWRCPNAVQHSPQRRVIHLRDGCLVL